MLETMTAIAVLLAGTGAADETRPVETQPLKAASVAAAIRLAGDNPGSFICTRVRKTGSRLATEGVCMSATAWRETSGQVEQIQRDLRMRTGLQG